MFIVTAQLPVQEVIVLHMSLKPHLTPKKLFGNNKLPNHWAEAKVAFICFTPLPTGFQSYIKEVAQERYFLHSPNAEVHLCQYQETAFITISEVYGFAVGTTTVEELIHYGIDYIIGIGYAGAFNGAKVGQKFVAKDTMSDLPIATHYGIDAFELSKVNIGFYNTIKANLDDSWGHYRVWNGNSLYREYSDTIQLMTSKGCDVVNMDTLSVYAASKVCAEELKRDIRFIYVGTVTDSANADGEEWDSDLIEAVEGQEKHPHDDLVKFMVEVLLPELPTI